MDPSIGPNPGGPFLLADLGWGSIFEGVQVFWDTGRPIKIVAVVFKVT